MGYLVSTFPRWTSGVLELGGIGDSLFEGLVDGTYIPGGSRNRILHNYTVAGVRVDMIGAHRTAGGIGSGHDGWGGLRIDQLQAKVAALIARNPTQLVVAGGINNLIQDYKPVEATALAQLKVDYATYVETFLAAFPTKRIVLETLMWQNTYALGTSVEDFNTWLTGTKVPAWLVTYPNIRVADCYTDVAQANISGNGGDGVHPGQPGYDQKGDSEYVALVAL